MKIKFFGQPKELVKERRKKKYSTEYEFKPLFRFDENGEHVIEGNKKNKAIIDRLKTKLKFEPVEETPVFLCKQCGDTFENKGFLMAHYRQEHPKEAR